MQTQAYPRQPGNRQATSIDIPYICRALLRNLFPIILCGWIGALWGFMAAGYVYAPTYTSYSYLVIQKKDDPDQLIPDNTINKITSQYQKTFTSKVMDSTIKSLLGKDELTGKLKASIANGTNILIVSATSEDPMEAFAIVRSAIQNYNQVTDYVINDYVLQEIFRPTIPDRADNSRGGVKLAFLAGCALMALYGGIVFLFNLFRNDVKNEKQVETMLDTNLFATWYYEKKHRNRSKKGILINSPYTSFLYTENVRKTATRLDYRAQKENIHVILVSSVQENEGKSTVAANLALALAAQNKKVLLIDGDLRKPSMYKLFEKPIQQEQEIGEYLNGNQSLQQVLTREEDTGLYYLFGSKAYRNSDKMLSSEVMQELIRTARESMDYIIIDSAPMAITSDAEILCQEADAVLMVVRQGYARVPVINDAVDSLSSNNVKIMGCLYNAVQTRILPKAAEYGDDYGYAYGYGRYNTRSEYGGYGKKKKRTRG